MADEQGRIHVYCGDGKGKTTAAVGLAVRAAGAGYRVIFAQFLKSSPSAELSQLEKLGIPVLRVPHTYGFTWELGETDKQALIRDHDALLERAVAACGDGDRTLLVLDELAGALALAMLDRTRVLALLKAKPTGLELVITGRDPAPEILEAADYITDMRCIRHPMDAGVIAREGIEY